MVPFQSCAEDEEEEEEEGKEKTFEVCLLYDVHKLLYVVAFYCPCQSIFFILKDAEISCK